MGACTSTTSAAAPPGGDPPANAVLEYYTIASLSGRQVFGPFLKLQSYDATTNDYRLTALVVVHASYQHSTLGDGAGPPKLSWGHVPGGGASSSAYGFPAGPAGDFAVPATAFAETPSVAKESVAGELLHTWRDWRFWRFSFGTKCEEDAAKLRYKVDLVPNRSFSVSVPSVSEPWHVAFYSCNGLHDHTDYGRTRGIQPLWADLMRQHAARPLHVILGGGDQLYNDGVFKGPLLQGWDQTQDDEATAAKASMPLTEELRAELEEYYFAHYSSHFGTQPIYSDALSCIPSVNTWDDHDIVDGWGSYPPVITAAPIMQGLFAAAKLFYLLFQHHTTQERLAADGYWCDSSSLIVQLGASTTLVVPDTRTFRTPQNVLPPGYLARLGSELRRLPASTRHVVVMMAAPVLYPALPVQATLQKLDDLATGDDLLSLVMQKTGVASKVAKRFGMVYVLDDIIDQWSSKQHQAEKAEMLRTLVAVADEKQLRITILSGDVHCAGYGMFHSRGAEVAPEDVGGMAVPPADIRTSDAAFIPQIISSAIANVPPPGALMKALCVTGRNPELVPHYEDCVQRMFPLFGPPEDVDSLLLGRRNWCEVTCGGAGGVLDFTLRTEKALGSEEINVFTVRVPPLLRFWQQT